MKVIAKGNFWSNGIEGFPGKVLTNEEQDTIGETLLDKLLKEKLIHIVDEDPFVEPLQVADDHHSLENLESQDSLESPADLESSPAPLGEPVSEQGGPVSQPNVESSPEPQMSKKKKK